MSVRLVAIDLDGTLLDSRGRLPPEGSRLVKRAFDEGVHVVISTTRDLYYVQRVCAALAISSPIICCNGALIYESPTGALWRELCIPIDIAETICQTGDERGWELVTSVGQTIYFRQRQGQALGPMGENRVVVESNRDALVASPHRILTWQPEAIETLRALCLSAFAEECQTSVYYEPSGEVHSLGIFARGADKGTALQAVLTKLNIPIDCVMAIGDNNNDLPMFDFAGYRVAMGNATEDLRQAAHIIAPVNDEEGVARVLERYVL